MQDALGGRPRQSRFRRKTFKENLSTGRLGDGDYSTLASGDSTEWMTDLYSTLLSVALPALNHPYSLILQFTFIQRHLEIDKLSRRSS